MLDQLLSEMGALRWELRCPQNLQPAKPQCYELHRNGALLAYISVAAADKAQENLLLKMLAAIDFELGAMVLLDDADTKLPLLQDYAASDINFRKIFIIPSLPSLIAAPELKRQAWIVLQQFRDYNL